MKNSFSIILGIVVVVLIAGIAYSYFGTSTVEAPVAQNDIVNTVPSAPATPPGDSGQIVETNAAVSSNVGATTQSSTVTTVTYTDDGFSPRSVTVKAGDKVTFVNNSSGRMWVASAIHPSHTAYSGTSRENHCPDTTGTAFDQCGDGQTYTFTFAKTGNWNYHNHLAPNNVGTIVVK